MKWSFTFSASVSLGNYQLSDTWRFISKISNRVVIFESALLIKTRQASDRILELFFGVRPASKSPDGNTTRSNEESVIALR